MKDPSGYFDSDCDLKTCCSLLNQEESGLDLVDKRQACSVSHPLSLVILSTSSTLSAVNDGSHHFHQNHLLFCTSYASHHIMR